LPQMRMAKAKIAKGKKKVRISSHPPANLHHLVR
jgi:hypothetical protein